METRGLLSKSCQNMCSMYLGIVEKIEEDCTRSVVVYKLHFKIEMSSQYLTIEFSCMSSHSLLSKEENKWSFCWFIEALLWCSVIQVITLVICILYKAVFYIKVHISFEHPWQMWLSLSFHYWQVSSDVVYLKLMAGNVKKIFKIVPAFVCLAWLTIAIESICWHYAIVWTSLYISVKLNIFGIYSIFYLLCMYRQIISGNNTNVSGLFVFRQAFYKKHYLMHYSRFMLNLKVELQIKKDMKWKSIKKQ